jgi:hypothetical protein
VPRGTQGVNQALPLTSTGLSPSLAGLSRTVRLRLHALPFTPSTPSGVPDGLGFSPFARHYSENRFFSSGY